MKRMLTAFFGLALLVGFSLPAAAQDTHTLTHDDFSLTYDATLATTVRVVNAPGDAPDVVYPGGPVPPHTRIDFLSDAQAADPGAFPLATVYLFDTADFAAYPQFTAQAEALGALLATRPDLAQFMTINADMSQNPELPYLPTANAAQALRAQPIYVGSASLSGIRYLAVYSQDASPFTSDRVQYTFQGVSADGTRYIAVTIPISAAVLPTDIPADFDYNAFNANMTTYFAETTAALNESAPSDFAPSLDALDALITSFQFGAAGAVGGAANTITETPMPQPTETVASAGALAGTWTLTGLGDPAALLAPLAETTPTLIFEPNGVTGNSGCNRFFGGFAFTDNTITFAALGSTRMACDATIMELEAEFLTALAGATNFSISGDTLTITYSAETREGGATTGALVFTRS